MNKRLERVDTLLSGVLRIIACGGLGLYHQVLITVVAPQIEHVEVVEPEEPRQ